MKRLTSVVLCCVGVAAIGATAALADNSTPNPNQVAAQQCTSQQHAMGVKAFKALYGDPPKGQHAMRNCQGKQHGSAGAVIGNAAQLCKAEQADPNFAANHNGMTFDQFYGTNPNDRNAFGKCVSGKVQSTQAQQDQNLQNAAQQCRTERNTIGDAAFTAKYGSNKNKKNAFGKCVSQIARTLPTAPAPTS